MHGRVRFPAERQVLCEAAVIPGVGMGKLQNAGDATVIMFTACTRTGWLGLPKATGAQMLDMVTKK